MKTTISTIYGAYLQACQFFKQPFTLVKFTTLNEKLGFMANAPIADSDMPVVQYYCIGRQGHRNATGAGGQPYTASNQHLPSDAGLYAMTPFQVRPINQDLTQQERALYGGRVVKDVNGSLHALYYLKVLDTSKAVPAMTINVKVDGKVSSRPFVPTSDNLSPIPPVIQDGEILTASGEYLAVKSVVEILLTAAEIEAIIEGCRILYDNEAFAIISEIGLVSAVKRQTTGVGAGNNTIQYQEAVAAQIVGILNTYYSLPAANNQIKETMTLGTSDPMLLNTGLTS